MKRLNIRWKLTLWYGGVLAVVLVAFSTVVYLTMRHQMLGRIDQGLTEELADVLYEVKRAGDARSLHEWLDRRFSRHEGFDFQITRPAGWRFFANVRLGETFLPLPGEATASASFASVPVDSSGRWRIVSLLAQGPEGPLTVQVARSLAPFDQESAELLNTFLLTCPVTLLIAVSGGYFLARHAMRPVQTMTRSANQISADRLNQRIDVDNPDDELGALARTLNQMIDRLERSFTEIQRFTADAAHELRTPLAVIRNEAEVALRATRTPEEYCRVLENLLEETNRLSTLADQLLFLCRQDAGLQSAKPETVAMDILVKEVVGNMHLVAEAKGIQLSLDNEFQAHVIADPSQLRRLFYNLLDNAIKYTMTGGKVMVSAQSTNGILSIAIQDTGTGIPQEHLPHIFERFYRVDPARTGETGAGLGLALCQSVVKGVGGTIRVHSQVGQGTNVFVDLPVAAQP